MNTEGRRPAWSRARNLRDLFELIARAGVNPLARRGIAPCWIETNHPYFQDSPLNG